MEKSQRTKRKFLLDRPAGKSTYYYDNMSSGTDEAITCGICGTRHPKDIAQNHVRMRFLREVGVEDCCGHLLDLIYNESGKVFTLRFLDEFARDPTNHKFDLLLHFLPRILEAALINLTETEKQISAAQSTLSKIRSKKS